MSDFPQLTPEYWLSRAKQVLALARTEIDPANRRTLESIAAHYEELARGCGDGAARQQPDHALPDQPARRRN